MSLNNSYNCSNTPPQVHNFMPMSSGIPTSHPHHSTQEGKQEDEAARFSTFIELQKNHVELFWNQQLLEIQNTTVSRSDHRLPLARVKRIMKSDAGVKMISSETPMLFSKACELFIMELTLRAWLHTEGSKRRTLQRCDIARAIRSDQLLYDFLASLVLCSEYQDDYFHCKKQKEEGNSTETNQDSAQLPPSSTTSPADATTGLLCLPLTNQDVAELEQVIKIIVDPNSSSLMSSSSREFPSK